MEKFGDYLKDIGLTSAPFTEKIESVYNICSQMCPEEIKDIFVTNYKKTLVVKNSSTFGFSPIITVWKPSNS
jgi:hypothetical protein